MVCCNNVAASQWSSFLTCCSGQLWAELVDVNGSVIVHVHKLRNATAVITGTATTAMVCLRLFRQKAAVVAGPYDKPLRVQFMPEHVGSWYLCHGMFCKGESRGRLREKWAWGLGVKVC